ncbi:MAG: RNA polymerase subunit sigma-24 [Desulfobacterales bacterium CG23_combo_of_CG06-09_8_20_14_all_51_8]|nr:MAG: RNA polymerase subunit sigma-24 [Desulfobacterales bacterium CG23_combo_of_CG06-09_8_20_14_all_51_8]
MPDPMIPASDEAIIERIVGGDVNAFEMLVDRHKQYVFSLVRRHVPALSVEDTAQDAFIRIYRALPDFSRQSSVKHWMTTITLRTCCDLLRNKYRSRETPMSALANDDQTSLEKKMSEQAKAAWDENQDPNETRALLDWALARLTPENRLVMELIYFEGNSTREAADLLGWSLANVKIRLFRSRKQLNTLLKNVLKE